MPPQYTPLSSPRKGEDLLENAAEADTVIEDNVEFEYIVDSAMERGNRSRVDVAGLQQLMES